ncbi:Conserved hypothetical protein [Erwinia tasmaniensis Et1/99]|uniref:Uncharacterized protein n=1 Tax=Erwinia tasmaniensis (strain DSM 17950 / CFBP 7177 / CIP 109463 / NCPPB 4357 / Et1/99) TaxID=465817 RepID=B2VK64_ERWT9|nr:Conserved hypothetical protein [Erwinia tasmaniensis Et1/99]
MKSRPKVVSETVSALCASFNTNSIAIPLRLHSWFNDKVATGSTGNCTFNQQQVALSVNAYHVQALNGYTFVTQLACHFLAFKHFARSLVLTDRTRNAVRQGVTVSRILSTEVPAFYSTGKTFTFRCSSHVNFFHVSENVNINALTYGELCAFSSAEFPQTTASFNASFSKVTCCRLSYAACFFSTGSYLNSSVTVVFQAFDLSNAVCFNFDHGYRDRNAIFCEDTSHTHFLTD